MAKLRTNHKKEKNPFIGLTLRVFLMIGIMGILFYLFYSKIEPSISNSNSAKEDAEELLFDNYDRKHLLPELTDVAVVHHKYYSLGYVEEYEQALWVSYVLNRDELKIPNVKRHDRFLDDDLVSTGSATYYDYRGSGYSRGHLAPAGDMAFSTEAMRESFYMSNMSPQVIPFNGGIWRELEESVRDWAYKNDHLYIVTGPILDRVSESIGKNKVGVPDSFYKAIMDIDNPDQKGIAFILPNEKSVKPLMNYAVSIDELEDQLGIDLYLNLLDSDILEEKIESQFNISKWPVSQKRYERRLNSWNNN